MDIVSRVQNRPGIRILLYIFVQLSPHQVAGLLDHDSSHVLTLPFYHLFYRSSSHTFIGTPVTRESRESRESRVPVSLIFLVSLVTRVLVAPRVAWRVIRWMWPGGGCLPSSWSPRRVQCTVVLQRVITRRRPGTSIWSQVISRHRTKFNGRPYIQWKALISNGRP